MKKIGLGLVLLFSILFAIYVSLSYIVMDYNKNPFIISKIQLLGKQSPLWYSFLFFHVFGSLASVMIGPFLFINRWRMKYLKWHRGFGTFYYLSILFGSISGFYLAFYATGGLPSTIGLLFLSILWFFTAWQAFGNIRKRNIELHQQWMIRNYSLTFAAVTLRFWLTGISIALGPNQFPLSFALSVWLSWTLNLVLAELIIRRKRMANATLKQSF